EPRRPRLACKRIGTLRDPAGPGLGLEHQRLEHRHRGGLDRRQHLFARPLAIGSAAGTAARIGVGRLAGTHGSTLKVATAASSRRADSASRWVSPAWASRALAVCALEPRMRSARSLSAVLARACLAVV